MSPHNDLAADGKETIRITVDGEHGTALNALIHNPGIIGYVPLGGGMYIEREGYGEPHLILIIGNREFTVTGYGDIEKDDLFNATIELIVSEIFAADRSADSCKCRKILVDVV